MNKRISTDLFTRIGESYKLLPNIEEKKKGAISLKCPSNPSAGGPPTTLPRKCSSIMWPDIQVGLFGEGEGKKVTVTTTANTLGLLALTPAKELQVK